MTEKSEAKRDGAKLQRNSGRGILEKGDARLGPFVVDYKEFTGSYGITPKIWAKICTDAWRMKGEPALKLIIDNGENKTRLWVISESMFVDMLDAWEEKYGEI